MAWMDDCLWLFLFELFAASKPFMLASIRIKAALVVLSLPVVWVNC